MCGYVAYVLLDDKLESSPPHEKVLKASKLLGHRGPDASGFYGDDMVSLSFKRLSIIDIETGDQPLSYMDGRYWIVFNGEIYNYLELRNLLINAKLKTRSDTEVILALYHELGEKVLDKLRGMFSFIIWDKEKKEIFGARDPFGIKPLYYLHNSLGYVFASEKKSLLPFEENNSKHINYDTVQHYLTFQYPPEPATMFKNIKKITPGNYFLISEGKFIEKSYFNPRFEPARIEKIKKHEQEQELFERIKSTLVDSVKMHMRSDVFVGAFLSSGIDSTSIVALAKHFHPDIKTFSSGFETQGYNEADVARVTAEELGLNHYTRMVTPEEIMKDLPRIIYHMDDPVADPAAIPLFYVSELASEHVKVVLSGEGADELFGGYNIYREPMDLKILANFPFPIKRSLFYLAGILPDGIKGKDFIKRATTSLESRYYGNARIFREEEKSRIYTKYLPHLSYRNITAPIYRDINKYYDAEGEGGLATEIEKMQYVDLNTWLPGDILVKADRMTMAHSLELRVPFLDKEVFKIAAMIPPELKLAKNTTKYALRKAVEEDVPSNILYRKKLGFPVPIRNWLKEEMFDWARQIIRNSNTEYLFDKREIFKLLENHRKGHLDYSRKIWTILTFMTWHDQYVEKTNVFSSYHS